MRFSSRVLLAAFAALAACNAQVPPDFAPAPREMLPHGGPAAESTRVTIEGSFNLIATDRVGARGGLDTDTGFRAWLGTVELADVVWVGVSKLSATVPAGLAPGSYTLSVSSPQGLSGALASAWRAGAGSAAALAARASAPAQVSVGEGFELSVEVQNQGGADALSVTPSLALQGLSADISPGPQDIPAQAARTFRWHLSAPTPGPAAISPTFEGVDAVSGLPLHAQASVQLKVQAVAVLQARALPLPARVDSGQPVQVVLEVSNSGGADALAVQPAALQLSGPGGLQLSATPAAQDVPAGATRSFAWTGSAATAGSVTLATRAVGSDANGAGPLSTAAATWTTEVQLPASLTIALDPVPAALSVGQATTLTARVGNTGGAQALGVNPSLLLSGNGSLQVLSQPGPVQLDAGVSQVFSWTVRAAQPGDVTIAAGAAGTDGNSGAVVSAGPALASTAVQRAPLLSGVASATPAQVSVGQVVTLRLDVTNGGDAAALQVQPSTPVKAGAATLQGAAPAPQDIPGGGTRSFTWSYLTSGAGQLSFSVGASGADANTGSPVALAPAQSAPVLVQAPAALAAQAAAPARRTLGDVFTVALTVQNNGGADARAVTPSLSESGVGVAAVLAAPAAQDIPAQASRTFSWSLRADSAGSAAFAVRADGADANSGAALTASSSTGTLLQAAPALSAALAAPPAADVGQTFTVTLSVRNAGDATAQGVAPSLSSLPSGLATLISGPSPATADLAGNASQDFVFTFTGASPGTLALSATATGRDANDGANATATAPNLSMAIDKPVQLSAALAISPTTVEVGQSFTATLAASNGGTAVANAVTPGALALSSSAGAAAAVTSGPSPASASIPGGNSASFGWQLRANAAGPLHLDVAVSGTDADSGAAVQASAPTGTVLVQTPPALSARATLAAAQISVGQPVQLQLQVRNDGQTLVQALGPVLSGCAAANVDSAPAALDVPGGGTATFAWQLHGSQPGSCSFSFAGSGTDANTLAVVPVPAAAASLQVQSAATLAGRLTAAPALVDLGQAITVTLHVDNGGDATATGVTPSLSVSPSSAASQQGAAPAPADLPGHTGADFIFTYVPSATGTLSFAGSASGRDANSAAALATANLSTPVQVQRRAALSASMTVSQSDVNLGQQFTVTQVVNNAGDSTANGVQPGTVVLSGAGGATLAAGPSPAAANIAGGGSASFTWTFQASALGAVAFSAGASGTDALDGSTVSAAVATSPPVTVHTQASLSATASLSANPLSTGQSFQLSLRVTNLGQVTARSVSPSTPSLSASGVAQLTSTAPAAQDIAGGASATFVWTGTASGAGTVTFSTAATGTDANTGSAIATSVVSSPPLLVQAPAALSAALKLSAATVNAGDTFTVRLTISNGGGAQATAVKPALSVSPAGAATLVSGPAPATATVKGGSSQDFIWQYTAVQTGALTFSGSASGSDGNSAAAVASGVVSASLAVQRAASLGATLAVPSAAVDTGQSFTVTMTVNNAGDSTASGVMPSPLVSSLAGVSIQSGPSPASANVAGGSSATFSWTCVAGSTGQATFSAGASGTDAVNGATVTAPSTTSSALSVQAPATLKGTLSLSPARASLGQTLTLTLHVVNAGGARALAVTPSTPSPSGAGKASLLTSPSPALIAGGAAADFTWTWTATGAGALSFSASASGSDENSGAVVSTGAVASAAVTLQAPAALAGSLQVSRSTADVGQAVTVTLSVSNTGDATASAVAPSLTASPAASASVGAPSPARVDIAGGAAVSFQWTVTGTAAGALQFSATAAGTDANSGAAVASGAAAATLTVQRPAALSGVLSATANASIGQSFNVSLAITNGGDATASAVAPSTLSFSGPAAAGAQVLSGPTPATSTASGGATTSFAWVVQSSTAGVLTASASAAATDANTGGAIAAAASQASTTIDTATMSGAISVAQSAITIGQSVVFTLTITNTGTVRIDNVLPGTPVLGGPGALTLTNGPGGQPDLDAGHTATWTWTYTGAGAGQVTFSVSAAGTDHNNGNPVTAASASGSVLVQTPPALTSLISISPSPVNLNQNFTVTQTVSNAGQAAATGVAPTQISTSPGSSVSRVSGPTPSTVTVPGGGSASFATVYTARALGNFTWGAGAQGKDANSGQNVSAAVASGSVTIQHRAALSVSISGPAQAETGRTFTVSLVVTNSGDSAANTVSPSSLTLGGTSGAATLVSGPVPSSASIPGHGSATFAFTWQAVTAGASVTFSGSASGTDATDGGAVSAASATSPAVQLVAPAALSSALSMPGAVASGFPFTVSLQVTNSGGAPASITPSTPTVGSSSTGSASLSSGPSPAGASTLGAGASQTFTWTYTAQTAGSWSLTAAVSGTDTLSGSAISASASTSTTIRAPVVQLTSNPPFGGSQPTHFAWVVGYQGQVWVGPAGDGSGAVRMNADGTNAASVSFQLEVESDANFTARNPYWVASPPALTLGYSGCAMGTAACGPDDEAGRGSFFSGTINGTEWLGASAARAGGAARFLYLTNSGFPAGGAGRTDFAFFNVFAGGMDGATADVTAQHVFHNQIFAGYADGNNEAFSGYDTPVLMSTLSTPSLPGRFGVAGTDVLNFKASWLPRIGANGGVNANPLRGAAGAPPLYVDAIGDFGATPNDAVYVANNGGIVRSTSNAPAACTAAGTCASWLDVTPTDANYAAHGSNISANTAAKFSDFEPADRAVVGFATLGSQLYAGRNTTAGPQLWVCTPSGAVQGGPPNTQCNAADWKLAGANTAAGLDGTLSQMNDASNSSITLLAAAGGVLFVGYNGSQGVQLYRTRTRSPAVTDFTGAAACTSSTACGGLGGRGLGAGATHIFDSTALTAGGVVYLYLTAGTGTGNVSLFRVTP